jgi:predicted MFS family arabinose efflux permease
MWYGIYLARIYHLDKLAISFFFIVTLIAGFGGQLLGGYFSDKKGRLWTCYLGIFGLALGTMFLLTEYSLLILGVVLFVISMSWTIGHNGVSTVLTDFPNEDRPVMASLNSAVRFISGGVGFQVSSFFVERSFELTFFIIGILILLLSTTTKYLVKEQ